MKQQEEEQSAEEQEEDLSQELVRAVEDVNSYVDQQGVAILSVAERTQRANALLRTHYNLSKSVQYSSIWALNDDVC